MKINAKLAPESYDEKFDRMKKQKESISAEEFMDAKPTYTVGAMRAAEYIAKCILNGDALTKADMARIMDLETGFPSITAVISNGARFCLRHTVGAYPTGIFAAGLTGTLEQVDFMCGPNVAMLRLDKKFSELDEWDNCLQVGIDPKECLVTFADLQLLALRIDQPAERQVG